MDEFLSQAELFQGLTKEELQLFEAIAKPKSLRSGEYLFLLGDTADRLYLVTEGKVNLCLPISLGGVMKDVQVESIGPGKAMGWSAVVRPFRFTLSARAAEATELVAFTRRDLLETLDENPRIGLNIFTWISETVGIRLLKMQALWARELQRRLTAEVASRAG
jgi:CRP-like cAMP-binding protein